MSIPKDQWQWFGNAGHFICGQWCRFHLVTLVGKYVVSTVGEYVHPRHGKGSERAEMEWLAANFPGEDIGCGRKFETMVFHAGPPCNADGCNCGMPTLSPATEIDSAAYNDRGAANRGHLELCEKWASRELQEQEQS